ncbi:MAG: bifunctional phosphopantothenoylcysteine decarboxylase/phosphopantothenate--cysteine ligase CoaBC [Acidobacteria bacterium]|jgi:phosphopantothenoylcysteine decarboxylase/phosphopantothenate--cysteine ligase|nr:bifunctional phosphopantothenoylcysteine decarboxylase/phosphopantothenate--cysteine ligase CoaBC [Acidobacteriota bacterium]MBF82857.1 bifunctional phosphopantothenoylcysteine decarboxylase/phosphopantothenate--cysteine ligase CoaBC [Acidobacteriota bacterium]MEC7768376.1 bifunctional phosphopantothenoylcysteine decarboxylase/phosphopantothenate--cysteine ligase CoaBC [Acidobacteriota bacterium]|tara:strand:- start:1311 stop:2528 length:1218 start_codon:yes stop_codon:yes gene_type:complete
MGFVALGVTGSVSAYKAVEVVRGLQKNGHGVVVIMTASAQRFVGPLTFEAITGRDVITDQFASGLNSSVEHVSMATAIDALVVAPATANVIGKFANGIADDFLTSLHLVTRAPILMAPAMNSNMWAHIAVVRNLAILREGGVRFVEPETGELACGWTGPGRLAEPDRIVEAVEEAMRPAGSLIGRCILITAGPTYEDLDPVRYLGNRSTGRMGLALAREAARRGARVIFISGPIGLDLPQGIEIVKVRSASDMHSAVMAQKAEADAMILAAAVADYTPMDGPRSEKMSKFEETLALTFVRTPDILGDLGRWRGGREKPVLVGFAAETEEVVARARAKLSSKQADLIVANDVSRPDAGFAVETNAVTLVTAESETEVPLQAKREVARVILDRVGLLLTTRATVNAG